MPKRAHPVDQEIVVYLRNRLPAKRKAKLESHFARCSLCYLRMQEFEAVVSGTQDEPEQEAL